MSELFLEAGGAGFCGGLGHCRGLFTGGEERFWFATISHLEWRSEEVVCGSNLFVRCRKLVGAHFG